MRDSKLSKISGLSFTPQGYPQVHKFYGLMNCAKYNCFVADEDPRPKNWHGRCKRKILCSECKESKKKPIQIV